MRSALSTLGRRTAEPPISWLMAAALSRPRLISLAAGFTDNATLPVAEVQQLIQDLMRDRRSGEPPLQYGSTAGLPELRAATAQRLLDFDAAALEALHSRAAPDRAPARPRGQDQNLAPYPPDQVLITHGSQQLLYLVTEALCDPGDIVLLEDPTYFVYLGIAQSHGLECRGLRLGPDGLDLDDLGETLARLDRSGLLPRVKLLYLVSYHQNPTGTTTAFAKKLGALERLRRFERAAGHPLYLLEDAAYRELRFGGQDVPGALAARGFGDRVLYVGTYSKPFATGVRVGFGVLPEPVRSAVARLKGNHDFGTANLMQHLLARALATGLYERHVTRLRRRYAHKAAVMTAALERHFPPSVRWERPRGGMYCWAVLPKSRCTGTRSELFQQALSHDVLYVPGQLCYAPDPRRRAPNHEMRLSYGSATAAQIEEGVARLGRVLQTV
ncbi:MAG: PLP-dependent aminotransferase family protein [Verrucomicrobia bacterium]|nr:PLP-dependent aminotransferase family protein [Verrucomicrobiota bacterium]